MLEGKSSLCRCIGKPVRKFSKPVLLTPTATRLLPINNLKFNRPILWAAHGMERRLLRLEVGFLDCCRISTDKRI